MLKLHRVRAILRFVASEKRLSYFEDAVIIVADHKTILETRWRNPELDGIWVLRYKINNKCLSGLLSRKLVEFDPKKSNPKETVFRFIN